MNNLNTSIKKFLGNKNTVTIIGVVICIFVLYVGYNWRINQIVTLVRVPYANVNIQPKTLITTDMISYMEVPQAFLVGSYYSDANSIVGKYSNYNTIIAQGSLFYQALLVDSKYLPDNSLQNVPDGYTVINYPVNMSSTYANSMMPEEYINIYFKAVNDEGKIMFGKFLSNIEILAVKDSAGQHVFESTEEARYPAYMLFAVPEETHLLLRKALYLTEYDVELLLVPNTQTLTEDDVVTLNSEEIEEFIEEKTQAVDVTDLPTIEEGVNNINNNNNNNNNSSNNNGGDTNNANSDNE